MYQETYLATLFVKADNERKAYDIIQNNIWE